MKSNSTFTTLVVIAALVTQGALAVVCEDCKFGKNVSCDLTGVTAAENGKYFLSKEMLL